MPFDLRDVGLECFTLTYGGEDVGAVFATDDDPARPWLVTLQERRFRSAADLPPPFTTRSHRFATLREVEVWLGLPAEAEAAA